MSEIWFLTFWWRCHLLEEQLPVLDDGGDFLGHKMSLSQVSGGLSPLILSLIHQQNPPDQSHDEKVEKVTKKVMASNENQNIEFRDEGEKYVKDHAEDFTALTSSADVFSLHHL